MGKSKLASGLCAACCDRALAQATNRRNWQRQQDMPCGRRPSLDSRSSRRQICRAAERNACPERNGPALQSFSGGASGRGQREGERESWLSQQQAGRLLLTTIQRQFSIQGSAHSTSPLTFQDSSLRAKHVQGLERLCPVALRVTR